MPSIGEFRLFAGHYQFILCDAGADPLREVPRWPKDDFSRGYTVGKSTAFIISKATLNNIVVRVVLSDRRPAVPADCERHITFNLSLPSGILHVTCLDGLASPNEVQVASGEYEVHVLSFHLGIDEFTTGELRNPNYRKLTDAERFERRDFEHHQVVLLPLNHPNTE